jgi:hypothetical protein
MGSAALSFAKDPSGDNSISQLLNVNGENRLGEDGQGKVLVA